MKTLIVDDDPVNIKLFVKYLNIYGQCIPAFNGSDAIEKFRHAMNVNIPFNLILLDIMMPETDGHTVLQFIRKIEKEYNVPFEKRTKIIMVTALSDFKHVTASFNEMADSYLVKPVDKTRLLSEINKICNLELK
ncbi:response regulator [candidate division KSB1 bacterium]|nr:response regulator [candidate division KSB1 bacterium]